MINDTLRSVAHAVFRVRQFHDRHLKQFAAVQHDKRILEIGSGKAVHEAHIYSAKTFFDASNNFIQTDINPLYGHEVVDVTTITAEEEYDIILCLNVLEHVFDFQDALDNMYHALKTGGTVIIAVPAYYPLHDEPHDYWRYTEHALRTLLAPYRAISLRHSGLRRYPFAYYAEATK